MSDDKNTRTNGLSENETDLQTLMRITVDGFSRLEEFRDETKKQFAIVHERIDALQRGHQSINIKLDRLELKFDQFRDETSANFDTVQRIIGSHEERITDLEQAVFPKP